MCKTRTRWLFIDNIFRFTQAGSEVLTLLGTDVIRLGNTSPNLADEMGQLQERITSTRGHSITSMQAETVCGWLTITPTPPLPRHL